jgi:hypothetical protein
MSKLLIVIDGEVCEVKEVRDYDYLPIVELEDGRDFYLARNKDEAGEKAREYWEEMAENDPEEFVALVGEKTLVSWALGQYAGPGSTKVQNLDEWLDLWFNTPEEQWASYDSQEKDCRLNLNLVAELGWEDDEVNAVCYRHN